MRMGLLSPPGMLMVRIYMHLRRADKSRSHTHDDDKTVKSRSLAIIMTLREIMNTQANGRE